MNTPRTDAEILEETDVYGVTRKMYPLSVHADFARRMERELAGFVRELVSEYTDVADVVLAMVELKRMKAELETLKRGEFICRKCGLRKDGECEDGGF